MINLEQHVLVCLLGFVFFFEGCMRRCSIWEHLLKCRPQSSSTVNAWCRSLAMSNASTTLGQHVEFVPCAANQSGLALRFLSAIISRPVLLLGLSNELSCNPQESTESVHGHQKSWSLPSRPSFRALWVLTYVLRPLYRRGAKGNRLRNRGPGDQNWLTLLL